MPGKGKREAGTHKAKAKRCACLQNRETEKERKSGLISKNEKQREEAAAIEQGQEPPAAVFNKTHVGRAAERLLQSSSSSSTCSFLLQVDPAELREEGPYKYSTLRRRRRKPSSNSYSTSVYTHVRRYTGRRDLLRRALSVVWLGRRQQR